MVPSPATARRSGGMSASHTTRGGTVPSMRRVWVFIAVLATVSAALWLFAPALTGFGGGWTAWSATAVMFGLVEMSKLHVEVRRQVWYFALGEIPIILALFLLQPRAGLLARLLPVAVVVGLRHSAIEKKLFNIALFTLDQAVAYLAFGWLGTGDPANPRDWLAAFVAVLLFDLVGALCLYIVISLSQGRLTRSQLAVTFAPNLIIAPFSTACALIV